MCVLCKESSRWTEGFTMNKVIRDNSMLVFSVKGCRMHRALSSVCLPPSLPFLDTCTFVCVCVLALLPVILAYLTEM